jgi:hypothetical protein
VIHLEQGLYSSLSEAACGALVTDYVGMGFLWAGEWLLHSYGTLTADREVCPRCLAAYGCRTVAELLAQARLALEGAGR